MLLKNRAGEQVLLTLKTPGSGAERSVVVEPITSRRARSLRYDDWEYARRLMVDDLGGGDIGYVHLRAMGGANYTEWVKGFYPVFTRQGLILLGSARRQPLLEHAVRLPRPHGRDL